MHLLRSIEISILLCLPLIIAAPPRQLGGLPPDPKDPQTDISPSSVLNPPFSASESDNDAGAIVAAAHPQPQPQPNTLPLFSFSRTVQAGLAHMSTLHPFARLHFAHANKGASISPSITDFVNYDLHFLFDGVSPNRIVSISSLPDASGWSTPKYSTIPTFPSQPQGFDWGTVEASGVGLEMAAMMVFARGETWDVWDVTVYYADVGGGAAGAAVGPSGGAARGWGQGQGAPRRQIYWGFTLESGRRRRWVCVEAGTGEVRQWRPAMAGVRS